MRFTPLPTIAFPIQASWPPAILALTVFSCMFYSCSQSTGQGTQAATTSTSNAQGAAKSVLKEPQSTIFPITVGAIAPPAGFERKAFPTGHFAVHLGRLPLKDKDAPVKLFDGGLKWDQNVHYAVIDLAIGNKDLHQCADALMRVRADFLRDQKRFDEIQFHFVSGFNCSYAQWMTGKRVRVSGNKVSWYDGGTAGDSEASYWKYLETVWSYASTLSLEKELKQKAVEDIATGDVWIKGGSPGHALLVVDVVQNASGEKRFLLAQSYMPAQEMHVLKNPKNDDLSPWYELPTETLKTPEWTFELSQLREW